MPEASPFFWSNNLHSQVALSPHHKHPEASPARSTAWGLGCSRAKSRKLCGFCPWDEWLSNTSHTVLRLVV